LPPFISRASPEITGLFLPSDDMKTIRVNKKRMERFGFSQVKGLRAATEKNPELAEKLKKDFTATLEAQGIHVDDEFKIKLRENWRNQIKADVRRVAEKKGRSEWYLNRVLEGKPIRVRVKVDREGGHVKKPLRGDPE